MLTTGNRGSKDGAICWCPLLSIFERLFTAYLKIFLINVVLPWSMLSDYLLLSFMGLQNHRLFHDNVNFGA